MGNQPIVSLGTGFWSLYAAVYDTLLALRPYTGMLREIVEGLQVPAGELVLDAGCGSGNLTRRLLDAGYQVEAVDSSLRMLQRASRKCPEANCRPQDLSGPLNYQAGSFSAITCSNVLYSLPDARRTILDFFQLLRPGGRLVLSNPCRQFSMRKVLEKNWQEKDLAGRLLFLARVPSLLLLTAFNLVLLRRQQADRFFFPDAGQLRQLFLEAGFEEVEVRPTYASQGWLVSARKPQTAGGNPLP